MKRQENRPGKEKRFLSPYATRDELMWALFPWQIPPSPSLHLLLIFHWWCQGSLTVSFFVILENQRQPETLPLWVWLQLWSPPGEALICIGKWSSLSQKEAIYQETTAFLQTAASAILVRKASEQMAQCVESDWLGWCSNLLQQYEHTSRNSPLLSSALPVH